MRIFQAGGERVAWPMGRRAMVAGAIMALLLVPALAEIVGGTDAPPPDEVFCTVNGESLDYADFYTLMQDQTGMEIAERMVFETVLQQEAAKEDLVPTNDEIDARVNELIAQRFGGDGAQFAQWMGRTGSTPDSLRRQVAVELMDLRLRSQKVEVSDEKLQEYFNQNHERRYDLPTRVRYRQVVLGSKDKADEVLAKIKSGDLAFFSAASRESLDPAAVETGGLVGPSPLPLLKELAPPIHDALTKLEPNQYTQEPVQYEDKWYLLLLIETIEGRAAAYDEVASRVKYDYLMEKSIPAQDYYQPLIDKAAVVGLPQRFRLLELQFNMPEQPTGAPADGGLGPTVTPQP